MLLLYLLFLFLILLINDYKFSVNYKILLLPRNVTVVFCQINFNLLLFLLYFLPLLSIYFYYHVTIFGYYYLLIIMCLILLRKGVLFNYMIMCLKTISLQYCSIHSKKKKLKILNHINNIKKTQFNINVHHFINQYCDLKIVKKQILKALKITIYDLLLLLNYCFLKNIRMWHQGYI
ncbi:hypothetical protein AGLY_005988 [Aphis glycines]|uniref:Uncharacterized protein n=1 Tax=Aphis glycines TaxID=307491 RepID=A0A6G0TUS7_APHGL|nr:hypothetical protein AGLY_005988 [Aphis glycines]